MKPPVINGLQNTMCMTFHRREVSLSQWEMTRSDHILCWWMTMYRQKNTILSRSLVKVVEHLPDHVENLSNIPANIKEKILYLMSKRGLITDSNIAQVLHPRLRVLDLSDSDNIGDESLRAIADKCKNLQKIDLNCSKGTRASVTSQGVIQLASGCQYLEVVYLRRCSEITDEAVIELTRRCPRLQYLNIGGCGLITDRSLQALGEHCKYLKSINFGHSRVTDEGVLRLVSGDCGKNIKELHMTHCSLLTDEAVEAVVQFCPNVSVFIFSGCPKITDQSRLALEEMLGNQSKMKQLTWTIY